MATRSSAPDVGMDLATPLRPPLEEKYGMQLACAAMIATESDGVTKKRSPRIMLRSASPSAAAPNEGTCVCFVCVLVQIIINKVNSVLDFTILSCTYKIIIVAFLELHILRLHCHIQSHLLLFGLLECQTLVCQPHLPD